MLKCTLKRACQESNLESSDLFGVNIYWSFNKEIKYEIRYCGIMESAFSELPRYVPKTKDG